jgi:hypothetical protein
VAVSSLAALVAVVVTGQQEHVAELLHDHQAAMTLVVMPAAMAKVTIAR